jgi:hypothetical protein
MQPDNIDQVQQWLLLFYSPCTFIFQTLCSTIVPEVSEYRIWFALITFCN